MLAITKELDVRSESYPFFCGKIIAGRCSRKLFFVFVYVSVYGLLYESVDMFVSGCIRYCVVWSEILFAQYV